MTSVNMCLSSDPPECEDEEDEGDDLPPPDMGGEAFGPPYD